MKQVAHIYHRRYAVLHVFYDVKNRLNISPFLEEKIEFMEGLFLKNLLEWRGLMIHCFYFHS